ncbi:M-phase phosphoprotein 8 [Octodon degus]|uniref:M-phase phosphoprotein 8 n=1 Tax=Octodon degus TaxID=10160 RepID=A0A6P6D4H8_OCTDE|nr:M-phase phosphoprotein 8 [Octodon degus]
MAAAADRAVVTVVTDSDADSNGELREVQRVGAVGEEKGHSTKAAEALGDSEEDGEDVFEVERILDMKTDAGRILYKVRWKGYTSDDDTWEPEIHLEDCKEKLSLNNDIFEANSDSDHQSETKEDTSPRKKKKKLRQKEEKSPDDLKKRKGKTGKLKDKSKSELDSSSESLVFDLRTKKRILEAKEELKDAKKPKKDELKEHRELKKVKKAEIRDLKTKIREDPKENRKTRKENYVESQLQFESGVLNGSPLQEDDCEELHSDNREEKQKNNSPKDKTGEDEVQDKLFDKQLDATGSGDEDADGKTKRRKKKLRKNEEPKEGLKLENSVFSEKKTLPKKQKNQERGRTNTNLEKLLPLSSVQTQRSTRAAGEEQGLRSSDSAEEYCQFSSQFSVCVHVHPMCVLLETESKALTHTKNVFDANPDFLLIATEVCDSYLPSVFIFELAFKEIRNAFNLFKKTTEEKTDVAENNWKKEEILDCKTTEDQKAKENKYSLKESRNTRNETDTWAHIAAEDQQEGVDSVCPADENLGEFADDLLRLLITRGAKVNGRQKNGTTALIHAAEKNFLTTVAILLEAGAFVNVQQSNGETALMKACKRGNSDIVRLVIECGADCNILSKHQNSALHFAKQCNNVLVYDLLRSHLDTLSRVAEETIRDYFEARLALLEPVFPIACHRLCEGPDFSTDFNYKPPQNMPDGSGILLFIFHANFLGKEVIARLCGPCSVQAVVLNDKFQLPVFLDSHFVYSFSPIPGPNKLFIRLTEAPTAKVKLLIGAYRVQLQ